jgi:hypothetical protein
MTNANTPYRPNTRKILETMKDGERHWSEELYKRLDMPRRQSATSALWWLAKHRYITYAEDSVVVIGTDRTDHAYVLTDKGRKAAENLDYGYDLLNP